MLKFELNVVHHDPSDALAALPDHGETGLRAVLGDEGEWDRGRIGVVSTIASCERSAHE